MACSLTSFTQRTLIHTHNLLSEDRFDIASWLPTRLSSGVLPGLFLKWYIFDMELVPGRYSSFSVLPCRECFLSSCSFDSLFLKLLSRFFDDSRLCARGDPGGDCGYLGCSLGRGVSPAAKSCSKPPPKEPRSTPCRFMGLLFGPGCTPFSRTPLSLSFSSCGLGCRGISIIEAKVVLSSPWTAAAGRAPRVCVQDCS